MQIKNSKESYGIIAMAFHWVMAILIIGLIMLGLYIANTPFSPELLKFFGLHKEFGIVVLILALARIIWRLANINPNLPESIPNYQKKLAHLGHMGLYFFMIAMPLSGWMMSSAAGFPVSFFGIFTMPDLINPNHDLKEIFEEVHEICGYALIALLAAHIGAVILHRITHKENLLTRMLPCKKS